MKRSLPAPRFLAVLVCCLSIGCARRRPPAETRWLVMGTSAAVAVREADRDQLPLLRGIAARHYDEIEAALSPYRPDSPLSRINAAAGTNLFFVCQPPLDTVLAAACEASLESGQAFSPLAGPLMRLWGFGHDQNLAVEPSDVEIAAVLPLVTIDALQTVDGPYSVQLSHPGMRLDLGGIAKGYAVDRVYDAFRAQGVQHVLIDLGGNLRVIGTSASSRKGWRTGVRDPFTPGGMLGYFCLASGQAVATSGNYERFVTIGGKRYAHIMDPRTGRPVAGMAAVIIVAPTAMEADWLSTTLFVLGPEAGVRLLRRHAGCEAVWIPDQQPVRLLATQGFFDRFTATVNNLTISVLQVD